MKITIQEVIYNSLKEKGEKRTLRFLFLIYK